MDPSVDLWWLKGRSRELGMHLASERVDGGVQYVLRVDQGVDAPPGEVVAMTNDLAGMAEVLRAAEPPGS